MKKIICLAVCILSLPIIAGAAWSFEWYNNSGSDIYCPDGSGGSLILPAGSASYTFALYLSSDAVFNLGGDTQCYTQTGTQVDGGAGSFYGSGLNTDTTPNLPFSSDPTYHYAITVLYQGTPSIYTAYAVLGATSLPAVDPSPASYEITVNGISAANVNSTWVSAVPEPSSMALLAIGLGVIALRRKFRV